MRVRYILTLESKFENFTSFCRQAALQAQKVFLHSLPRHPGDAPQFWERIYSELSKITDESAARVPASAEAEPHTPRGQAAPSVDSGHLQFESPRSTAAVKDRTSQDSGHVDWEHRDVSNRGGVPKGSPRPVLPLESIPPEALGDAALDESALPHPPHVLRPLQEGCNPSPVASSTVPSFLETSESSKIDSFPQPSCSLAA